MKIEIEDVIIGFREFSPTYDFWGWGQISIRNLSSIYSFKAFYRRKFHQECLCRRFFKNENK